MEKILHDRRPDIVLQGVQGQGPPPGEVPFTICALTYLSRPQNLPPFYNAALSLTRMGIRVDAYGTIGRVGSLPYEIIAPGFSFTRIGIHSRNFFYKIPGRLGDNLVTAGVQYVFSFFEYNIRIYLKAMSGRADIVEAHDLPSLLCARLIAWRKGCPIVFHAHELWSEMGPQIRFKGFWQWFQRRLIRGVDLVVTPEVNRARIYRDEYGFPALPLVIANCPPFKAAGRGTTLRDMAASKGMTSRCLVLYQGVISGERCIDEIVAATEYLHDDVALTIIGNGFDEWSDPPSRFPPGRRIVFLPHVPYETLVDYTASADIGLLFYRNTCRNNYYCAPNKLYEYMMMGLPVVTCNYPGLVGFVEGQGIGLCVDPEDPRAIADAVNRIASDGALRDSMSRNCLRLARDRWNWENEFARLYDAYLRLPTDLAGRAPASAVVGQETR